MTGGRDDKTTHFGFREVPESAKAGLAFSLAARLHSAGKASHAVPPSR